MWPINESENKVEIYWLDKKPSYIIYLPSLIKFSLVSGIGLVLLTQTDFMIFNKITFTMKKSYHHSH